MNSKIFKIILLILFGLVIYSNSFQVPFQYDDYIFISGNPDIRDITNIKAMWNSQPQNSRFVATVTFAINYAIGKLDVVGYHVVNIIIHLINGFLVWWLVRLLFNTPGLRGHRLKEFSSEIGWLSAMLFIAHPLQTQAVTYITQRYASLATLFYLLTMCWYLKGRSSVDKKNIYFIGAGISALLGVFTKEMTMTIPLMLLLTEWLMFEHKNIKWQTVFIYSLVLLGFLMIVPALMHFNFFWAFFEPKTSSSHTWDVVTLEPFLITQLKVWVLLLAKFVIPIGQNLDYDFPLKHNFWQFDVWGSGLVLAGLLIFALVYRRKNVLVSYGIMWFFVAISIEFVPRIYLIFEHKMYLPIAGLSMAVIGLWREKIKDEIARIIIISAVIVALGFLTFNRNAVWGSAISLWSDVVSKSPNKASALHMLAFSYIEDGDIKKGYAYLERTLNQDRYYVKALYNKAYVFIELGQNGEALKNLNECLRLNPHYSRAYVKRGLVYTNLGEYQNALNDFAKAIELEPRYSGGYLNRGVAYYKMNNILLAIKDFKTAINLAPEMGGAYYNLFSAYKLQGDGVHAKATAQDIKKFKLKISDKQQMEVDQFVREN
ncbi:MAG: tetratricopeptide repeat protein [Candidatus Omnitrophica bacterium]|nr:tetratricopeptide repeat protein [Candidatus Omnitrophota bacterium]